MISRRGRIEPFRQTRDNSFLHGPPVALPLSVHRALNSRSGISRPNLSFTRRVDGVCRRGGKGLGLAGGGGAHKGQDMNLNSRLFDRIRVKPAERAPDKTGPRRPCSHPGCQAEGVFRAPKGREREGEYLRFCKDHVREYNASYDYFRGMDDESMAKFRQADAIGHRPTWKLGARARRRATWTRSVFAEARAARRRGVRGANRADRSAAALQRPCAQGADDARA